MGFPSLKFDPDILCFAVTQQLFLTPGSTVGTPPQHRRHPTGHRRWFPTCHHGTPPHGPQSPPGLPLTSKGCQCLRNKRYTDKWANNTHITNKQCVQTLDLCSAGNGPAYPSECILVIVLTHKGTLQSSVWHRHQHIWRYMFLLDMKLECEKDLKLPDKGGGVKDTI